MGEAIAFERVCYVQEYLCRFSGRRAHLECATLGPNPVSPRPTHNTGRRCDGVLAALQSFNT